MVNDIEPQLYLIDKPAGITSHDVVALIRSDIRNSTGDKVKVGHSGTLDPFATGLLIVLLGPAVKAQTIFMDSMKSYDACIQLGVSTDTGDVDGKTTETKQVPTLDNSGITAALNQFIGKIVQPVPIYAAAKVNGRKLYEYARSGQEPPVRPIRICNISAIEFGGYDEANKTLNISVSCSSGTYIRALAEQIANRLGTVGHLYSLRRTDTGGFNLKDAVSIKSILRAP